MISGASKARLRWPTVTWRSMCASVKRLMASLVCTKLRPIREAALLAVRTGAPTSRGSSRSAAELALARPKRARQSASISTGALFEV